MTRREVLIAAVGSITPASPRVDVPEFDAAQTIAEGRLRIIATDRREYERRPLKFKLPVTGGMPAGTKIVRRFFNDSTQAWCLVVTHPNYLKSSPSRPVVVMTLVLKVGE